MFSIKFLFLLKLFFNKILFIIIFNQLEYVSINFFFIKKSKLNFFFILEQKIFIRPNWSLLLQLKFIHNTTLSNRGVELTHGVLKTLDHLEE